MRKSITTSQYRCKNSLLLVSSILAFVANTILALTPTNSALAEKTTKRSRIISTRSVSKKPRAAISKPKSVRSSKSASKRLRRTVAVVQRQRYFPRRQTRAKSPVSTSLSSSTRTLTNNRDPAQNYVTQASQIRARPSTLTTSSSGDSLPNLEIIRALIGKDQVTLERLPAFDSLFAGKLSSLTPKNEFIFYTLNPSLQDNLRQIIAQTNAPHVAAVVLEPSTGKILAMAGKSVSIPTIEFHNDFPAASLFKVITAAAAIENASVTPETVIRFRGGNYTLSRSNFFPSRHDKREMSVGEALGKSINPVFGRLALEHLTPGILRRYVQHFGFGSNLNFDAELPMSIADIPDDDYELSRTGAGFGNVRLSPVHAAAIMGGIANQGQLLRPYFVEKIVSPTGKLLYKATPRLIRSIVAPRTAKTLLEMMEYTITVGTSRGEFMYQNRPVFPGITVAGKTGTLSGTNPKGLNNWFIATAPVENPQIAIAVITVDAQVRDAKASHLGRLILERIYDSYL